MSFHHLVGLSIRLIAFAAIIFVLIFLFNKWLNYRERSWAFKLKQDNNKALAPLRISAYERIVIMLERISPQPLVMRLSPSSNSAGYLQMELIRAIREEYEHNVSLQVYVSQECWEQVLRAKEQSVELIKVAFTKVRPDSSPMELSRAILMLESEIGSSPVKNALIAVRMEMAKHF